MALLFNKRQTGLLHIIITISGYIMQSPRWASFLSSGWKKDGINRCVSQTCKVCV